MASLSGNSKIRKLCENRLKKYFENASMEKNGTAVFVPVLEEMYSLCIVHLNTGFI